MKFFCHHFQNQRSRFQEQSKISPPAKEGLNKTEDGVDSSSTSFVSKWIVTLKKAQNDGKIKPHTDMVTKRSVEDFRELDRYLKSKHQKWSECSQESECLMPFMTFEKICSNRKTSKNNIMMIKCKRLYTLLSLT